MTSPIARQAIAGRGRLVTGAFLGIAAGMVAMASLEAMLVPIQNDFVLSVDDFNFLVLSVSAGALLVLFAIGGLVDRIGCQRIVVVGAVASSLGALLVSLSQGLPMLMSGRILGGIGGTAMGVASLALLNETFTEDRQRAWVFGLFAAITGVVFAMSPVVSGLLSSLLSWRVVPLLWIACAVAAAWLVRATPSSTQTEPRGDALTPWAAGLMLSSMCLAALLLKQGAVYSAISLAICLSAALTLGLRWRWLRSRGRRPGLDVSVFRAPGAIALAGAMLAVGAINLVFYANLFMQYRLGLSPTQTALFLLGPQASGIAGGLLGGWLGARWGSLATTAASLAFGCLAALSVILVGEESTAVLVVAVLSAFTLAAGCITGSLTKAFLDCAEPSASGAASSWRQGAWSLGTTLGGVAGGAVILTYFTRTWASTLEQAGVDPSTAQWAAESVRGGVPLTQVTASPTLVDLPGGEAVVNLVGLAAAQIGTLRVIALLAALAYAVSLSCVLIAMWRKRVAAHA